VTSSIPSLIEFKEEGIMSGLDKRSEPATSEATKPITRWNKYIVLYHQEDGTPLVLGDFPSLEAAVLYLHRRNGYVKHPEGYYVLKNCAWRMSIDEVTDLASTDYTPPQA
jgi:hypothetical protein